MARNSQLADQLEKALQELEAVAGERDVLKRLLQDRPTHSRQNGESSTPCTESLVAQLEDYRRQMSDSGATSSKMIADLQARIRRLEVDKQIATDDKNDLRQQLTREEVRGLELLWREEETRVKLRECEESRTFLMNDSYHNAKKLKKVEEEVEVLRQAAKDHDYELQQRDETIAQLEREVSKLKGLLQARDDDIFRLTREKEALSRERAREEKEKGEETTAAKFGTLPRSGKTQDESAKVIAKTLTGKSKLSSSHVNAPLSQTTTGNPEPPSLICVICGRTKFRDLTALMKHSATCTDFAVSKAQGK